MKRLLGPASAFWCSERGGANIYIILALSFGLLLITPFFINSVSLFITRRTSVTAADSASLAGAEAIAEYLTYGSYPKSQKWIPSDTCAWVVKQGQESPAGWYDSMNQYLSSGYYRALQDYGISQGVAEAYAASNHAPVVPGTYQVANSTQADTYNLVGRAGWQDFPAIAVSLRTQREYVPAAPAYVQNQVSLEVPAVSSAEVYMDSAADFRNVCWSFSVPVDCGAFICWEYYDVIDYRFDFHWKIRLKQYQGG